MKTFNKGSLAILYRKSITFSCIRNTKLQAIEVKRIYIYIYIYIVQLIFIIGKIKLTCSCHSCHLQDITSLIDVYLA